MDVQRFRRRIERKFVRDSMYVRYFKIGRFRSMGWISLEYRLRFHTQEDKNLISSENKIVNQFCKFPILKWGKLEEFEKINFEIIIIRAILFCAISRSCFKNLNRYPVKENWLARFRWTQHRMKARKIKFSKNLPRGYHRINLKFNLIAYLANARLITKQPEESLW